jgi:rod shape-determining protein MreC
MAIPASSGIARRRSTVRRVVIAGLVVLCLVIFTGYFRESGSGPFHSVQNGAASVVAPVQEVATRAVEPVRDGWGWISSLRDARDRAAALETENEALRAAAADNAVRDQKLQELEALQGVAATINAETGLKGDYGTVTGLVYARSVTDWYRSARIDVGSSDGVVRNSPVVAGNTRGAALVGVVTAVSSNSAEVAFITDGRTEVGASIPQAGNYQGLVQSTTPGELEMTGIPRAAPVRPNQTVVTGGFSSLNLPSIYPRGIPIGQVTSVGSQEVDVQQTVQVTPFVDPRQLTYLVVLTPESREAKRRAAGG